MPIRVVLGEDSFLAREAITSVLEGAEGVELVAACGDLEALRDAIDRERPDAVLTDIRMPPGDSDEGIRLAVELRSTHPDVGVVVLSHHAEAGYAVDLFRDGAERRGYLLKERVRNRADLEHALEAVAAGGSVVDPAVVEHLVAARRRREDSKLDELTPRELQILALIAEGRSNAAIADELVVTKRAVERHVNRIFAKLGLQESEAVSPRVKAALLYLGGAGA